MPRAWTEQSGGAAKGLRRRLIWTGIVFLVSVLPGCGAGIASSVCAAQGYGMRGAGRGAGKRFAVKAPQARRAIRQMESGLLRRLLQMRLPRFSCGNPCGDSV